MRRWILLAVAGVALANGGCLVVAAGLTGAAVAGYAYHDGKLCGTFNAGFEDTWAATLTALGELGMRPVSQEKKLGEGFIESRTADGERVRITIETRPRRIPADGAPTRVCVRVATFGDHPVSTRILNQVSAHLVHPAAPPPLAAPPVQPARPVAPVPPIPPQTEPPPLGK